MAFRLKNWKMMRAYQTALYEKGIYVMHSNYIGAGKGGAIRISVFADHKPEHFDRLIEETRKFLSAS